MKPMMIVDCPWKGGKLPMNDAEKAEYDHWCDKVHIPDLLRDTGMTRVTRYRDRDGAGMFYIQEFDSQEALEKYLLSDRRRELVIETNTHYPSGENSFFEARTVRCFIPVYSEER